MSLKMEVNHLKKEELQFELRFRGVDSPSIPVEGMRSSLRSLLRMESANQSLHYPPYSFVPAEDIPQMEATYNDLEQQIGGFSDTKMSTAYKRCCSRLYHLLNRIDTIPLVSTPGGSADPSNTRSAWLSKTTILMDLLETVATGSASSGSAAPPAMAPATLGGGISGASSPLGAGGAPSAGIGRSRESKTQPVHKWNLKFSGDLRGMSVVGFLERVTELQIARRVSDDELFASAIDLFEGKALIWYRSNFERCGSWDELAALLKMHFLPPDYKHRLYQEILQRTQGVNESIVEYMSCLKAMFLRHGSLSEEQQLDLIIRNLAPFYSMQLPVVNSLNDVEEECLKLEVKKFRADSYHAPPRRSNACVEPDLACVSFEADVSPVAVRESSTSSNLPLNVRCYNCSGAGHLARFCPQPVRRRCFRCGKPDFTVRTCPACSSGVPGLSSGNGDGSH